MLPSHHAIVNGGAGATGKAVIHRSQTTTAPSSAAFENVTVGTA